MLPSLSSMKMDPAGEYSTLCGSQSSFAPSTPTLTISNLYNSISMLHSRYAYIMSENLSCRGVSRVFKAHRLILMARSPVMYEMFHASPSPLDTVAVAVTNVVDPEAFSQMLRLVVLLVKTLSYSCLTAL